MRVAYLLSGFVRKLSYLNEIKNFLELNKEHHIDLYSNTYNVLGSEFKEPSNKRGYVDSVRIDGNFANGILDFKKIQIEDYDQVDKEISLFAEENISLIKKSPFNSFNKFSGKMGSVENEQTTLRVRYAQERNLFKTFELIEGKYDLIIKSRYDAYVSQLDLSAYEDQIKSDIIFSKGNQIGSVTLDNGYILNACIEIVMFGHPDAMKILCEYGIKENFIEILKDQGFRSQYYYDNRNKDIKLMAECCVPYRLFFKNKLKSNVILDKHLPGTGLLGRRKYPV